MCLLNQFLYGYILQILDYSTYVCTGCLRNYRKLRLSVLGRLRELQYIFAVIYETLCITCWLNVGGSNMKCFPIFFPIFNVCN